MISETNPSQVTWSVNVISMSHDQQVTLSAGHMINKSHDQQVTYSLNKSENSKTHDQQGMMQANLISYASHGSKNHVKAIHYRSVNQITWSIITWSASHAIRSSILIVMVPGVQGSVKAAPLVRMIDIMDDVISAVHAIWTLQWNIPFLESYSAYLNNLYLILHACFQLAENCTICVIAWTH